MLTGVFSPELAKKLSLRGQNAKFQLSGTAILDSIAGELITVENDELNLFNIHLLENCFILKH